VEWHGAIIPMLSLDPNFKELLKLLNSGEVKFLVLGGYAVNFHGYHRNTADIDLWIAVDPHNAEKVSHALQQFGFPAASVPSARTLRTFRE